MTDEAYEATPDHELERQIMSYNEAKNEREWWAMHEIERLREALRKIEYLDSPQVRGLPRRVSIHEIARAALGENE